MCSTLICDVNMNAIFGSVKNKSLNDQEIFVTSPPIPNLATAILKGLCHCK